MEGKGKGKKRPIYSAHFAALAAPSNRADARHCFGACMRLSSSSTQHRKITTGRRALRTQTRMRSGCRGLFHAPAVSLDNEWFGSFFLGNLW